MPGISGHHSHFRKKKSGCMKQLTKVKYSLHNLHLVTYGNKNEEKKNHNKKKITTKAIFVKASLCERLRTYIVFTKDQYFYLNYHKFSIKSYVVDVY